MIFWLAAIGVVSIVLFSSFALRGDTIEEFFFRCSLSNNLSEQKMKSYIGRKEWLFSDSPEGAEASAISYSISGWIKCI